MPPGRVLGELLDRLFTNGVLGDLLGFQWDKEYFIFLNKLFNAVSGDPTIKNRDFSGIFNVPCSQAARGVLIHRTWTHGLWGFFQ